MSARFALVKRADVMARDFLPPEKHPAAYGYPAKRARLRYRGLGRDELDLYDTLSPDASPEACRLIDSIEDGETDLSDVLSETASANLYASAFDDAEDYELLFLVTFDDDIEIPAGFRLLGYDVSYLPEDELFSAVSDLFFYPLWHGADPTGKAYAAEFALLNASGLFPDAKTAAAFRDKYASDFHEDGLFVTAVFAAED